MNSLTNAVAITLLQELENASSILVEGLVSSDLNELSSLENVVQQLKLVLQLAESHRSTLRLPHKHVEKEMELTGDLIEKVHSSLDDHVYSEGDGHIDVACTHVTQHPHYYRTTGTYDVLERQEVVRYVSRQKDPVKGMTAFLTLLNDAKFQQYMQEFITNTNYNMDHPDNKTFKNSLSEWLRKGPRQMLYCFYVHFHGNIPGFCQIHGRIYLSRYRKITTRELRQWKCCNATTIFP